jgi:PAS domain S-box-containing protein
LGASFPIPENEAGRLAALGRYRLLDPERDRTFDRIADMARSMFGAARGIISFVDADHVWFKSGARGAELPREHSFCAYAILSDAVLVIPDAAADPRFRDNAYIIEAGTRFYAAAPLVTRDGYRIGTLNVTDTRPRPDFGEEERERLKTLAQLVMNELELRHELQARIDAESDLALINRLMIAIAEAPDAREALDTSMRLIALDIGAAHGAVWRTIPLSGTVRMIASYASTPFWQHEVDRVSHLKITLADSVTGLALSGDKPVIIDVKDGIERFPHLGAEIAAKGATTVAVPLVQSGNSFALHFFFAPRPDHVEALAKRVSELGERIRPALVRKLSEEWIAQLQSLLQYANDAALVMMPDSAVDPRSPLHIVYCNPALTRMTGYDLSDLAGERPTLLWGEEGGLATIDSFENGDGVRRELRCRRNDGAMFWADINAVRVESEAFSGPQVIAILRDTTERRELEQALSEREQHFHLMFESAPVPMMLLDVKMQRYVEVNEAALRLLGYTREQFLAMSAEEIRAPAELERYKAMLTTPVPSSGRRGQWRYIKSDGSEVLVDIAVHPFRLRGRAMAITVAVDVTEQKQVEHRIRAARDAAEAASRAKTDLLANMSHELRTPLNAIIGFSQILHEELFGALGSPRYHGYVGDILESARHLLAVINDILDLAKIEANSFRLREGPVDLGQIVGSALRLVRPRADEANIKLEFDHRTPGLKVTADETAVKRVLVNLLSNAVKFSEASTIVTVRCEVTASGVVAVAVQDRGIGMAPEDIATALTPFQQVDIGLRRKYEGTGLGLPIAKQLMELHGGQLKIESARGQGTTVTMTFPAARIVDSAAEILVPTAAQLSAVAGR